jgi:hypothetical protein
MGALTTFDPKNPMAFFQGLAGDDFREGELPTSGDFIPRLSVEGNAFTIRRDGVVVRLGETMPAMLNVVVVRYGIAMGREYYGGVAYSKDKPAAVACWSPGAERAAESRPSPNAVSPQANSCALCPMSAAGSAGNGRQGKACGSKYLHLLYVTDPNYTGYVVYAATAFVHMSKVSNATLKNHGFMGWAEMVKMMATNRVNPEKVQMQMVFDSGADMQSHTRIKAVGATDPTLREMIRTEFTDEELRKHTTLYHGVPKEGAVEAQPITADPRAHHGHNPQAQARATATDVDYTEYARVHAAPEPTPAPTKKSAAGRKPTPTPQAPTAGHGVPTEQLSPQAQRVLAPPARTATQAPAQPVAQAPRPAPIAQADDKMAMLRAKLASTNRQAAVSLNPQAQALPVIEDADADYADAD